VNRFAASGAPRRIVLMTPGGVRARGGIGRLVAYVVSGWDRPDLALSVVDTYGPGPRAVMPFYFGASLVSVLIRALAGRIDLLHINMAERLSVLRKGIIVHLGHALGLPIVLHLHGAEFAEHVRALSPGRLRRLQAMMGKADRIVVLGDYWRRFVVEELALPAERVAVLHNAVPSPEVPPERATKGGPCRILFLGAVSQRKGVDVLLRAASQLARHDDWQLLLAGNEVEDFRGVVQAAGLADRVRFLGWVDTTRAHQLLAECDVLVLPSRNEGLPMAILEGMSFGLPIVATPVGSICDAITDDVTGRLVPVGDDRALADTLRALIKEPVLRGRLGDAAHQRYEERFCLQSFNAHLADIFQAALAGDGTAPPRFATGGV
jgi:glycosyltransferase involved in cell wall biosynthesis